MTKKLADVQFESYYTKGSANLPVDLFLKLYYAALFSGHNSNECNSFYNEYTDIAGCITHTSDISTILILTAKLPIFEASINMDKTLRNVQKLLNHFA